MYRLNGYNTSLGRFRYSEETRKPGILWQGFQRQSLRGGCECWRRLQSFFGGFSLPAKILTASFLFLLLRKRSRTVSYLNDSAALFHFLYQPQNKQYKHTLSPTNYNHHELSQNFATPQLRTGLSCQVSCRKGTAGLKLLRRGRSEAAQELGKGTSRGL